MDASLDRIEEPPYIPDHAIEAMAHVGRVLVVAFVADKRGAPRRRRSSEPAVRRPRSTTTTATTTRLTDDEVDRVLQLIGAAGTETLTKLLANAVVLFQRNPAQWQKVLDDPGTIAGRGRGGAALLGAVAVSRAACSPTTSPCTASRCPKDRACCCSPGAANRDEREYDDPDRFDIERADARRARASATGCTSASAPRSRGSKAGSRSRSSPRRFPNYEVDEAKRRPRAHEQRARVRVGAVPPGRSDAVQRYAALAKTIAASASRAPSQPRVVVSLPGSIVL